MSQRISELLGLYTLLVILLTGVSGFNYKVSPDYHLGIHVIIEWEDTTLSSQNQLRAVELIRDELKETFETDIEIMSLVHSIGVVRHNSMNTVGVFNVDRLDRTTRSMLGKSGGSTRTNTARSVLAAVDQDSDDNTAFLDKYKLNIDTTLKAVQNKSSIDRMKGLIENQLFRKQQTTWRSILGYTGRLEPSGIKNIIFGEEQLFSVGDRKIVTQTSAGPKLTGKPRSPSLPVQGPMPATRITTPPPTANTKISGYTKAMGIGKTFPARHFADGATAQQQVKMAADARYFLKTINKGSTAPPDLYFPPVRTPIVYTIDTTVLTSHVEFGGRVEIIWNGHPEDGPTVCQAHGTHVVGSVAGETVGMNKYARVRHLTALNCEGFAYTSDLIIAMIYLKQDCVARGGKSAGPFIVNKSYGGPGDPYSAGNAGYAYATAQIRESCDAKINVAAGNSNEDACMVVPAGFKPTSMGKVFTVGATDRNNNMATYSNYGPCVDLFAPGNDILSAGIKSNTAYAYMSGTSMAVALVSGLDSLSAGFDFTTWRQMYPNEFVSDNIRNYALNNTITAVRNLPRDSGTTARLAQVGFVPITTSQVLGPVSPAQPPPAFLARSSASSLYLSFALSAALLAITTLVSL